MKVNLRRARARARRLLVRPSNPVSRRKRHDQAMCCCAGFTIGMPIPGPIPLLTSTRSYRRSRQSPPLAALSSRNSERKTRVTYRGIIMAGLKPLGPALAGGVPGSPAPLKGMFGGPDAGVPGVPGASGYQQPCQRNRRGRHSGSFSLL